MGLGSQRLQQAGVNQISLIGEEATMNRSILSRAIIPAAMLALLVLLASRLVVGNAHEWLGVAFFALVVVHNIGHRKWWTSLARRRFFCAHGRCNHEHHRPCSSFGCSPLDDRPSCHCSTARGPELLVDVAGPFVPCGPCLLGFRALSDSRRYLLGAAPGFPVAPRDRFGTSDHRSRLCARARRRHI